MALKLLVIFAGGGVGATLRYLVTMSLQRPDLKAFPWGTLAANIVGCAVIGFVMAWIGASEKVKPEVQLAIIVGLLGGFTTFSSFAYEAFRLANADEWTKAIVYVVVSNVAGIGLAALTYAFATRAFFAQP